MEPLFSIITVCYNSSKTIEKTIESVLNQNFDDYEYLIIDGQSTDGTIDIVESYKEKFGKKLRLVSEKDNGIYEAMNKGISMAKGKLIGLINSDDYYEPDALRKVSEAYEGYEYSVVYGMLRTLKNSIENTVYLKSHMFIEEDMIAHPSCFISKKIYDEYGAYSLEYPCSADYEFMLRIRNEQKIRYYPLYEIISNFSTDGVSAQTKGYLDTMRLKKNYGLIGGLQYFMIMLKCRLAILLGK